MVLLEKSARAGKARIRRRADHDFEIGEPLAEFLDDALGRVDLANTDSMEPDALAGGIFAHDFAESLGPAGPIAVVSDSSIYHYGAVRDRGQQVQQIQHESHLANLQKTKRK